MRRGLALLASAAGPLLLAQCVRPAPVLASGPAATSRVSLASDGKPSDGESAYPSLSADGHEVAFASSAANLVAGDRNGVGDVFVLERASGKLCCASVAAGGAPAAGESYSPSLSGDGQRLVFVSEAADLVAGDDNQVPDVFLRDLATRTTTRLSLAPGGAQADGASSAPRISSDGSCVVFVSLATNLLAGGAAGEPDVFLRELRSAGLERIGVGEGGAPGDGASEGPALSSDGRYVAFASTALNLVSGEKPGRAARVWDVYRRDRKTGTTVRISANLSGGKGDGHSFSPAISADGRYVAFASHARNLVSSDLDGRPDVFVRDVQAGTTQRVSIGLGRLEPTGDSLQPSLSADGRFVSFESSAGNLVAEPRPEGSTWIYLRDLSRGLTTRVVAASAEAAPEGGAVGAALSADGRWIAFSSAEPALAPGDTHGFADVFVRGPLR